MALSSGLTALLLMLSGNPDPIRGNGPDKRTDSALVWIIGMSDHLRWGYRMPGERPEVRFVSRAYIKEHADEVCALTETPDERETCVSHLFGKVDDERVVWILRADDVAATEGFPAVREFSSELWTDMVLVHELVHYVQLWNNPGQKPSTLSCEVESRWEAQADFLMTQWLHHQRSVDAERLNAMLRGSFHRFPCIEKEKE